MGMAVGVDYSLFYLKREREERSRGRGERESLLAAAATSGRAVLVSGVTVVVGCAGMVLSGANDFVSIGVGAMLVVLVAMVGSLTVLPALLGKLGDRVDRGVVSVAAAGLMRVLRREPRVLRRLRDRRTLLQRAKAAGNGESRLWGVLLRPALRRPRTAATAAVVLLVALALPLLRIHTAQPGVDAFPQDLPIVKAYKAIDRSFPGSPGPAEVVLRAPSVDAPSVRRAVAELRRRALASGVMHAPIVETVNPSRTVARIDVPLAGNGTDHASVHALGVLRQDVLPASLGTLPHAAYGVTGDTATSADFGSALRTHTPLVFAFVLVVAFVVLLLAFGSLVVPLTAIALNLLSVGAAYGVLVWVFQDGHLHGLLGFQPAGSVVTWLPLFLFTVLFGLSMDYHVFIVSRIRELAARGVPTEEAVARGIRSTAATVTSAAAVMIAVFSIFALTRPLFLKELGVGLAVAILLDATVVRAVLLPAVMTVLGERNWYLPRRLGWLPRLRLDETPAPVLD
jgi:RND superfamily putative drug exporter